MCALYVRKEKSVLIEPGLYDGKLVRVEEVKMKFGPSVKFTFEITNASGPVSVSGIASLPLRPGCKLDRWLRAFGVEILEDTDFDLEQLVGRYVKLLIGETEASDGKVYSNVIDIKPGIQPNQVIQQPTQQVNIQPQPTQSVQQSTAPKFDDEIDFDL